MVRLAEADLYASLAPPGTKACDAAGGAFRPEGREEPVTDRLCVDYLTFPVLHRLDIMLSALRAHPGSAQPARFFAQ